LRVAGLARGKLRHAIGVASPSCSLAFGMALVFSGLRADWIDARCDEKIAMRGIAPRGNSFFAKADMPTA
jgi:hypothetical protein